MQRNTASVAPAGTTAKAGRTSTSGQSAGTEVRVPCLPIRTPAQSPKPTHGSRVEAHPRHTPQESNAWHDRALASFEATRLYTLSGLAVPRLRKAWVPQEGGICKKEVKTPWKVRYACQIGRKGQMDVKYVPKICCAGRDDEVFFQYTMIEETGRKLFIYAYRIRNRAVSQRWIL